MIVSDSSHDDSVVMIKMCCSTFSVSSTGILRVARTALLIHSCHTLASEDFQKGYMLQGPVYDRLVIDGIEETENSNSLKRTELPRNGIPLSMNYERIRRTGL